MAAIKMTPEEALASYRRFLGARYPRISFSSWNTNTRSGLSHVVDHIEVSRIPEVLRKGHCPWKWHVNHSDYQTRVPPYVKDGWVVPENGGSPGSCFTVVEWYAELAGITAEGGYNEQ